MKQKQTSWQPVSTWYDSSLKQSGDYTHESIIIPHAMKLLSLVPTSRVLDLGCGQGILARTLPKSNAYTGIDIAPSLIEHAKTRNRIPHHRYIVADITKPLPLLPTDQFTHIVSLLTLDNIEHPDLVIGQLVPFLVPHGSFTFVINHPAFRIPRQSSWGIDEAQKLQYRRINRYLSPLSIPISMHPGQTHGPVTWTFHFSLATWISFLTDHGFVIDKLEEWTSQKSSVGKAASMENMARQEFPLFLAILARVR